MLDMMGHVSVAMLRRYSHIRKQARLDAIDALESRQFSIGHPMTPPKSLILGIRRLLQPIDTLA